ncbi:MAG: ABC transporter permease, partial [Bacteroidota bacterium]
MFKNYLKTALRNLSRNKIYSILNVVGLSLGIGCALVIFKVISFENSFDKHQKNYNNIYRIVHQNILPDRVDNGMGTPHPVGPAIKADYPDIKEVVRTNYTWGEQINIKEGSEIKKFLYEEGVTFTENAFFTVFDVDFKAGNEETALTEPNTVVISESEARKLFSLDVGSEAEAMGRMIDYGNLRDFEIVGVINDPPEATNFPFTLLFEYSSQEGLN